LIVKPNMTALGVAIEAVSDRWSLTIVRHLAFGPLRFTDLVRLTSAPRDVLTARLRSSGGRTAPASASGTT
jgi:DNA-binding HxlR family transcriptional regulator